MKPHKMAVIPVCIATPGPRAASPKIPALAAGMTALLAMLLPMHAQAETVKASVNGIICAYCVQGIEKAFRKHEAVEAIKVDLDNGLVTLTTKGAGKLADATVKQVITDAGYSVTGIARE